MQFLSLAPDSSGKKSTESCLSKDGSSEMPVTPHSVAVTWPAPSHTPCPTHVSFKPFFKAASFLPLFSVLWEQSL